MASLRDLPARPRNASSTPHYPRRILLGALALAATTAACKPAGYAGGAPEEWGGAPTTSTASEGGGGSGTGGTGGTATLSTSETATQSGSGGEGGGTTTTTGSASGGAGGGKF